MAGEPSPPTHQGHADPLTDLSRELPGQHLTRPADCWLLSPSGSLQVVRSPLTSTRGHPSPFTSAPHGLAQLRSPQLGPRMLRGSTMTPGHRTSGSSSLPTLTLTHMLTHTHADTLTQPLTYSHMLSHTCSHTCSHTHVHTCSHSHTCSHTFTHSHTRLHTQVLFTLRPYQPSAHTLPSMGTGAWASGPSVLSPFLGCRWASGSR